MGTILAPVTPSHDAIIRLHDATIARDGGAPGLRDQNVLLSVWSRIDAALAYADPDAVDLAALLMHGILRNHPFVDGNKRSAWGAFRMTMAMNGMVCDIDPTEACITVVRMAEEGRGPEVIATRLRPHCRPDPVIAMLFAHDRGDSPGLE